MQRSKQFFHQNTTVSAHVYFSKSQKNIFGTKKTFTCISKFGKLIWWKEKGILCTLTLGFLYFSFLNFEAINFFLIIVCNTSVVYFGKLHKTFHLQPSLAHHSYSFETSSHFFTCRITSKFYIFIIFVILTVFLFLYFFSVIFFLLVFSLILISFQLCSSTVIFVQLSAKHLLLH